MGAEVGAPTGWGQYMLGLARGLDAHGHRVIIPAALNERGILPMDLPRMRSLVGPMPDGGEPGWLFRALGNELGGRYDLPAHVKQVALCVFEDTGALDDNAVDRLRAYDALIAPSVWVLQQLEAKGLDATVCHQGYDERVFVRAERPDPYQVARGTPRPVHVFSGGKLEFRKGQDIVVEAVRRFRATPEGAGAVLVTAWHNPWPATMDGVWLSGYVRGVPNVTAGRADIVGWLALNGLPPEAVIDCGPLSPPELAHVLRSCDVGVFPSRCEGATNMMLVEALGAGLPCIVSSGHGHADTPARTFVSSNGRPVPSGCRLYRGTDGWTEADVDAIVPHLRIAPVVSVAPTGWDWPAAAQAFVRALAGRQDRQEPVESN